VNLNDVETRNINILNFLKNFSSTLELLNLGPYFTFHEFCKGTEWKDDITFPKVRSLTVQIRPSRRACAIILKENALPKFPNLEFLKLQHFFDVQLDAETEMSIQAAAVAHI